MSFDFEVILVLLTVISGAIWGWDKLRQRRAGEAAEETPVNWWVDLGRSLFPVILIVLVIRSFLFEPFRIPSGSMIPTLFDGDFILVNKFAYGLRLPAVHSKFLDLGEPDRGDVVVFRFPLNPSQDYIKRVVGLPGDRIVYKDKHLYINGELMDQLLLGRYSGPEQEPDALLKREQLGEVEHSMVLHTASPSQQLELVVPEGSYFMMGDNRDRSSDSRFWGPVPEENLVGKAFLIWMSWNPDQGGVNWDRLGDSIH